jgi:hypothetical protein
MSYVEIHDTFSEGMWRVRPEQYEAILHAWESRDRLIQFTTEDGADVTIRGGAIRAVVFCDDAAEAAVQARVAQEKLDGKR